MTTDDIDIVLREVGDLLRYHLHLGIDRYPPSAQIDALLNARPLLPEPVAKTVGQQAGFDSLRKDGGRPLVKNEPTAVPGPVGTLADIHEEVAECTRCSLASHRVVPVAGVGPEKARLLIVGEWLALPGPNPPPSGCVFGVEQDQMVARMLEAIQLNRKDVFITNVIKCGIEQSCQPKAEHVAACSGYLQKQILALAPKVICCMGRVATRIVLGRQEPLSRLRGRLHMHSGLHGRKIPVIPTYHPTFLLQNPEMKKATWIDLQLLARELAAPLRS